MRKMLFCLIAAVAFIAYFTSCGCGTASKVDTDSIFTVDSIVTDTLVSNTVVVDSVE